YAANFEVSEGREVMSATAKVTREDAETEQLTTATLSIDTRDCIGCDVCVAHCDQGVLKMVDGKALVDLRHLNKCDLDGECVEVCPTDVVSLILHPIEKTQADQLRPAAGA